MLVQACEINFCYSIDKKNASWQTGRRNCITQVLSIEIFMYSEKDYIEDRTCH